MNTVSVVDINLSAVQHNMRLLRRIIGPECALCPIIKADAYGLGGVRMAKALVGGGADLLAVYTPEEAAALFAAAVGGPILVLMPVRAIPRADELYRGLVCGRLHLTIHDQGHLEDLLAVSERYGVAVPVHLEVDTGMGRGGCSLADAPGLLRRIHEARRLTLAGVFTHFASADTDQSSVDRQTALFDGLLESCAEFIPATCRIHAANSYATLRSRRYHKSMVRVGLAYAGYGPELMEGGEVINGSRQLQPSVTWESGLIHIKTIAAGSPVGYGSSWTAARDSVIGLVPAGYADGYPRGVGATDAKRATGWVRVLVDGADSAGRLYAPVIGAVNMDQVTIDLTDVVASVDVDQVGIGTRVELITPDASAPNHLPVLARAVGTVPHELLCRLNPRIRRTYHVSPVSIETERPAAAVAG